jgi:hypothetical protein
MVWADPAKGVKSKPRETRKTRCTKGIRAWARTALRLISIPILFRDESMAIV